MSHFTRSRVPDSSIESLERRSLLSDATLDIDASRSSITAAGTVNSVSLAEKAGTTPTAALGGTITVSYTKRGLRFQGSDITVTPNDGETAAFSFQVSGAGPFLDVNDPAFDLSSRRISLTATGGGEQKFSTARITAGTADGSVAVTGLGTDVDLTGGSVTVDYAVAHIKAVNGKLRLMVPFSFSVSGNYTLSGVPQALDLNFTGDIVARGEYASGAAFIAKPSATQPKKDRVNGELLEG